MKNIVVFIEKIKMNSDGSFYLLLDFPAFIKNDIYYGGYSNFLQNINQTLNDKVLKSMLEIDNLNITSNIIPREGSFYTLPESLLRSESWVENEDSDYIAYKLIYKNDTPVSFSKALRYRDFIKITDSSENKNSTNDENHIKLHCKLNKIKKIKLIVFNIGHGNMNLITINNYNILYDIGSIQSKLIDYHLKCILRKIKIDTINQKKIPKNNCFILSHWDIDHYNGIEKLEQNDLLGLFDLFIVPKIRPTSTSERHFQAIVRQNKQIIEIEMRSRPIGDSSASKLIKILDKNYIKIFKGSKSSNRNKSGIVVSIHNNNKVAILTGDHHYHQIDKYVIPNYSGHEKYFVVPHHGGFAGNDSSLLGWTNCEDAIISENKKRNIKNVNKTFKNVINTFSTKNNYIKYL